MSEYSLDFYKVKMQTNEPKNEWFKVMETRRYLASSFQQAAKKAEDDGFKIKPRQTVGLVYEIKIVKNLLNF